MSTETAVTVIKTLEPTDAVALWRKGKDEWNKWVKNNPKCNISFENVDFGVHRDNVNSSISFQGFQFPVGEVSFKRANFCDGGVNFSHVNFGDGDVNFIQARFGDGNVSFVEARFGKGNALFSNAEFGNGDICFFRAKFGGGKTSFSKAKFGRGEISFFGANFGGGPVNFSEVFFCDGNVCFSKADFGGGRVTFISARFGQGLVSFWAALFHDGDLNFSNTQFGDGSVIFNEAQFGRSNVSFDSAKFCEGDVSFLNTQFGNCSLTFDSLMCKARFTMECIPSEIKSLSFRGATFTNSVSLSGLDVNSMVDLVNTKLTNQLSLHRLECKLKRTRNRLGFLQAEDSGDAERANRAKELAEANKHHALALRFHADEMRAKRWQSGTGVLSSTLDLVFDLLCDYGQRVFRPTMLWVFSIFAFVLPYAALAKECLTSVSQASKLLIFSLSNSLPFLTSAGAARTEGLGKLFDENITYSAVLPLMMAQGVVTVILMFLIGLGLRNRFRL